jgi:uncharacterized protein YecT (DUF1311 family)
LNRALPAKFPQGRVQQKVEKFVSRKQRSWIDMRDLPCADTDGAEAAGIYRHRRCIGNGLLAMD